MCNGASFFETTIIAEEYCDIIQQFITLLHKDKSSKWATLEHLWQIC